MQQRNKEVKYNAKTNRRKWVSNMAKTVEKTAKKGNLSKFTSLHH